MVVFWFLIIYLLLGLVTGYYAIKVMEKDLGSSRDPVDLFMYGIVGLIVAAVWPLFVGMYGMGWLMTKILDRMER